MAFKKGASGNPTGRPKETPEQKEERDQFKDLLTKSTVSAMESIIEIANERHNRDRFNACKFIIEKAYGANTAFLLNGEEEISPIIIEVVPYIRNDEGKEWEQEWNSTPDKDDNNEEF